MTERYLRSITADYITGVVSACEGIHGSLVCLDFALTSRVWKEIHRRKSGGFWDCAASG